MFLGVKEFKDSKHFFPESWIRIRFFRIRNQPQKWVKLKGPK